MYIYCLFCETVRCGAIADFLGRTTNLRIIRPKWVQRKWIKGQEFIDEKDLFPGYLFLYAEEPLTNMNQVFRVDGVIRFLGLREDGFALKGDDLRFAQALLLNNGRMGQIKVYREGDRLQVLRGALGGYDGEIVRVDRQRARLQLRFSFDNAQRTIWVGYDEVE